MSYIKYFKISGYGSSYSWGKGQLATPWIALSRDPELEYNGKIKSESTSAYEVNSEGAGLASAYFKTGMVWESSFDVCEK